MTKYGRSPWLDRFPRSRVPSYPRHRGPATIEVVIVGGGLTGCAIAYAFAANDIKVALVERARIGRGATGFSTGWIGEEPGPSFLATHMAHGAKAARWAWKAWHRAALDFQALLRRLPVACDLASRTATLVATRPDDVVQLRREHQERRDAGLETAWLSAKAGSEELALAALGAIRSRGSATIDPYRACLGLATAATRRGARLFEQSPVTAIRFGRRHAEVRTEGGAFRTRRVVVATAVPTGLFHSLARHFWFRSSYLALTEAPAKRVRDQLGTREAFVRDAVDPPHSLRWVDDRLMVAGADRPSPPAQQRNKTIVQRTGQLMYELSTLYPDISGVMPAYGWDLAYAQTADGLPYIGPHRNYPHHLFAFGNLNSNLTAAYLASRILLRRHLGAIEPADEVFGFNR